MKPPAQKSKKIISDYFNRPEKFWLQREKLLRRAVLEQAKKLPAYRRFLKFKNIAPKKNNWPNLPSTDKKNYFAGSKPKDLGILQSKNNSFTVLTSTSGSTGKPAYFFRNKNIDWQYSVLAEYFISGHTAEPILVINCFSMGIWIGGVITYQAFYAAGERGGRISIITPGINKKEIFQILKNLAPNYKTIIFTGYPPFIKDIIDESATLGISLKKYRIKLLFAAESFTEGFRDYLKKATGLKNLYVDTLNIYGSAELGAMAFETAGAILIRRLAMKNPQINLLLFGDKIRQPTLTQYNPDFISFEAQDGRLLLSALNATPFVKYDIGDIGGVWRLSEILKIFKAHDIDLRKQARKAGVKLLQLPFVYVHERADFSTTLYGLQIYPQSIKRALEHPKLQKILTGKFTISRNYDKKSNQFLELQLECKINKQKVSAVDRRLAEKLVIQSLLQHNSEYRELATMLGKTKTRPRLNFWSYNHPQYFQAGIKQSWREK